MATSEIQIKKSNLGGRRPGAGRPKGSQNKATVEENIVKKELRDRVLANWKELISAQMTLAKGVSHVYRLQHGGQPELVTNPDEIHEAIDLIEAGGGRGEIQEDDGKVTRYYFITTRPPDNKALDSLLDRALGKATFALDVTSGGQPLGLPPEKRAEINRLIDEPE